MKKKVLVISYTFHPSNQIGGRRWTKFVRLFLKHHNIDVKVITSKNNKGKVTENEILDSSIEKISFNDFRYLGVIPRTIFEKSSQEHKRRNNFLNKIRPGHFQKAQMA